MGKLAIITLIKSIGMYVLALFLTRIMGRKLISQMTFFDFVVGISMGTLVANTMVDSVYISSTSLIALIAITILTVITALLSIKSIKIKKLNGLGMN